MGFKGREVVMKYSYDGIDSIGEFRTDANGRQFMRRIRNQRFSYDLEDGATDEPISSNYYPVNAGKTFFTKKEGTRWNVCNIH